MIHFICALLAEARPIIEFYQLKHIGHDGLFNIYYNEAAEVSLTVSGVGKLACSAASIYSFDVLDSNASDVWINVGIAGHEKHPIGKLFLANYIEDQGSNLSWYPQILIKTNIEQENLLTLDKPSNQYDKNLFDMEASGFMHSCSRFSTMELIHSLKIISDNALQPSLAIQKSEITLLVKNNLVNITQFAQQLRELSADLNKQPDIENQFMLITNKSHFSHYQRNRLRSILSRWQLINQGTEANFYLDESLRSAEEIMSFLENHLDNLPMHFSTGK